MYRQNTMGGFFDDLLQTGERIATSVINRPQPVYTQPTFPYGTQTWTPTPTQTGIGLGTIALVGLGVYLLMNRRGRR